MEKYWNTALAVSFLLHFAFGIIYLPTAFKQENILGSVKIKKEIKIMPQEISKIVKEKIVIEKDIEQKFLSDTQFSAPPYISNIADKLIVDNKAISTMDKPQIISSHSKDVFISDNADSELIKTTPSYMSYYNSIRARLYSVARRNYKIKESGEVSLQFVISRDGRLQYVESSGNSEVLKELGLKIVKESFPFTPFPEELKGSSCPFSVVIDFKNN
jgi:hypothetical protein